jgi:hypothetical protein
MRKPTSVAVLTGPKANPIRRKTKVGGEPCEGAECQPWWAVSGVGLRGACPDDLYSIRPAAIGQLDELFVLARSRISNADTAQLLISHRRI